MGRCAATLGEATPGTIRGFGLPQRAPEGAGSWRVARTIPATAAATATAAAPTSRRIRLAGDIAGHATRKYPQSRYRLES